LTRGRLDEGCKQLSFVCLWLLQDEKNQRMGVIITRHEIQELNRLDAVQPNPDPVLADGPMREQ